ncbi:MAG: SurA N-terminal domain-containing protein [Synergistaceae bacterium]|nr:SurA N-terminal domain-containing protein [Synergistaceae bacterium]
MNKLRTQMRWIMVVIATAFILSSFLMYERGGRGGGSSGGARGDYAVAEVNGRRLMLSTMYEHLQTRMDGSGGREITSMDFQAVLEEYAVEAQMAQEIRNSGITVTDAEVDQVMKEYVDQIFPTRESFQQYLDRTGRKLADYKKDLAQQIIRQKFIEESIGAVTVDEDEAANFYDRMKNLFFSQPSGYRANLARFSSEAEALRVRELLSEGRSWEEATSHDVMIPSDVIYVTEEPMFFSDAAFNDYLLPMKSVELGVASPVFEMASDDFVVGVKSERVEERVTPYDEVSADVRTFLHQQKEREAVSNFSAGLFSRARVVILDPSLFPSPEPDFQPVADAPENTPDTAAEEDGNPTDSVSESE